MCFVSLSLSLSLSPSHTHTHVGGASEDVGDDVGEVVTIFTTMAGLLDGVLARGAELAEWYKSNHIPQVAKILITYLQILGSFTM
jgi:hypothetical protein